MEGRHVTVETLQLDTQVTNLIFGVGKSLTDVVPRTRDVVKRGLSREPDVEGAVPDCREVVRVVDESADFLLGVLCGLLALIPRVLCRVSSPVRTACESVGRVSSLLLGGSKRTSQFLHRRNLILYLGLRVCKLVSSRRPGTRPSRNVGELKCAAF